LFANPAYSSPALSEDGETLAVIGSKGDEQIIITRPVAGGPLTGIAKQSDPERRVAWLEWANSRRLLMSVHGRNPNGVGMRSRATYLFGVDADGKNFGWLGKRWPTFGQGDLPIAFQDRVIHWTPSDPETVLIQIRPPYRQDGARVMKMNVDSGALTPVAPAEKDIEDWYADQKGNVRAGIAYKSGNTEELWTRIDPKAAFDLTFRSDTVKPELTFLDFHGEDPSKAYVLKNLDGHDAVYEFDLREKKLGALVFARPDVDLDGLVRSSDDARVIGILYRTDSPQIKFLDAKAEHEYASIQNALEREFGQAAQVDPVSQSREGNRQVLKVSSDTQPPTYFLYDRALKNLFPLIEGRPGIRREQLSPTKRVTYAARDGLSIPAYLTLPRGHEPRHLPLIALVHGGPMAGT
jgi:dipeptidyl aminopeptidase/acylaminoacyl peptidase